MQAYRTHLLVRFSSGAAQMFPVIHIDAAHTAGNPSQYLQITSGSMGTCLGAYIQVFVSLQHLNTIPV